MTLCNDVIFRYVFGKEENTDILLDLVNAVLSDKHGPVAASLELVNPIIMGDTSWLKEMVLDIRAKDQLGRTFNVEMQVCNDSQHHHRSLVYWAAIYSKQLPKGDDYDALRPVICINVLDFKLFPDLSEAHNCFTIRHTEQPELELTDHLALHFIELGKPAREGSRLAAWKTMFHTREPLEECTMPPLLSTDPVFRKVVTEFKRCTEDDHLHEIAVAREKFRWEQKFYLHNALEKGRAEGKEESARNLKSLGVAVDIICQATGLDRETVEGL